jgi:Tol biopolymer transport system component
MIPADSIEITPRVDTRRFWTGVTALVVALLAAILFVALQGSHASVRARRLQPAPGSTVSVRPPLRVLFTRPVDKGSVENAVTISPETAFDLSWNENELRILPRAPFQAETEYTVTIGPGISDTSGNLLEGQLQWQFRTRQPQIAFIRPDASGASELWLTRVDGTESRRLSAPGQMVHDYDPAPDGSAIVYAVQEAENTVNLWQAPLDREGLNRLTEEPGTLYSAPRYGPSGDLLAVEVRKEVTIGDQGSQLGPPRLELRRPTDGSPAGTIFGEGPEIGHTPRWSYDGTRVAFFASNANAVGLYNFTSELRFFPAESAYLGGQAWSPDGRALTYTVIRLSDEAAQQVVVVRDLQLGTESTFAEPTGDQSDPAWSPDGSAIAYAYRNPLGGSNDGSIWLMRPDGTGKVLLVAEPDVIYSQPLWSPDGAWMLFGRVDLASETPTQSIWAIRSDGTELHQVAGDAFQAIWVP